MSDITKLLFKKGFTDWGGTPATTEQMLPSVLEGEYRLVTSLYQPSEVLLHIQRKGKLYVTTYIPVKDFILNQSR